jgi:dTMP kinase
LLIAIEGTDGSGKSTQCALLTDALRKRGIDAVPVKLPHYTQDSSVFVRRYLAGVYGTAPADVNAYAASLFFALDRYDGYKTAWGQVLSDGRCVIADRYVGSNAYHQASKLPQAEWAAYFSWLADLEYGKLGLPQPDLTIYLDMPPGIAAHLLSERCAREGTARDIHESDTAYLRASRAAGRAAALFFGWETLDCAHNEKPHTREFIHERILQSVERVFGANA